VVGKTESHRIFQVLGRKGEIDAEHSPGPDWNGVRTLAEK
jgi:hypothetical protein